MTQIHLVTDADHIKRCAPVLRELRTFLTEDQIVDRVQEQMTDGYRLACVEAAGSVASVAGYRILRNLIYGKFLYVAGLERVELAGVGHFVQRERPGEIASRLQRFADSRWVERIA
jgi:hypothetical protein